MSCVKTDANIKEYHECENMYGLQKDATKHISLGCHHLHFIVKQHYLQASQ